MNAADHRFDVACGRDAMDECYKFIATISHQMVAVAKATSDSPRRLNFMLMPLAITEAEGMGLKVLALSKRQDGRRIESAAQENNGRLFLRFG